MFYYFVYLEDSEAGKTRHELDEVRLTPRPGHTEGPLHKAGPGEAPDPVLHVVIKLGAPTGEAGLASVRIVSVPVTGWRLQSRVIRGHSVARGQVPGHNNNNTLLEMVQDIPDLLAWGKIRDNCHC